MSSSTLILFKGCSHDGRIYLVTYKSTPNPLGELDKEAPKLLCSDCFNDPTFNNPEVVDLKFNIETGEILK